MSSTNRGAERNASDYYVTPIPAIELFLRSWAKDETSLKQVKRILDPCAGGTILDGQVTVPMSYAQAVNLCPVFAPQIVYASLDIRPDSCAYTIGDYLTHPIVSRPDLIISNPPFNLARQFVDKALADVRDGGFVAFLLRLNFFGAQSRRVWHQANMPYRCYVHPKRPSFAKGPTDSNEYAHFVWRKGLGNTETLLKVI
jgi:hypothetical protein